MYLNLSVQYNQIHFNLYLQESNIAFECEVFEILTDVNAYFPSFSTLRMKSCR